MIGSTWSFTPDNHERIYAVKTNAWGDTSWSAILGYSYNAGGITQAIETADKGFLTFGSATYQLFANRTGSLIKLDRSGNVVFTKIINHSLTNYDLLMLKGDNYENL